MVLRENGSRHYYTDTASGLIYECEIWKSNCLGDQVSWYKDDGMMGLEKITDEDTIRRLNSEAGLKINQLKGGDM